MVRQAGRQISMLAFSAAASLSSFLIGVRLSESDNESESAERNPPTYGIVYGSVGSCVCALSSSHSHSLSLSL
ncbi:hypothetical protein GGS21DRAFT_515052 [Xylaria nigripes]|nr:hypothetical protein GGS21DRAFT_515052 [Xylaria nigripes]